MISPVLNTSSAAVAAYLNGEKSAIQNCTKCIVDVRDVALAHILALKKNSWGKRHLLVGGCPSWEEIVECSVRSLPKECASSVRERIPTTVSDDTPKPSLGTNPPHPTLYDCSQAEEALGMKFRGVDEMVAETVSSLFKWGHVNA